MRITIHATIENADGSSAPQQVQIGEVTRDAGVDPASGLGLFVRECAASGEAAQPFAEGRMLGSLGMTSYLVGMSVPHSAARGDDAQSLPIDVPPEQTNT